MKSIKLTIILSILLLLCACGEKTYTGALRSESNASDPDLNISVDAPILVRNVEMVQYYKDEAGNVSSVLANYPIESFDGYTNPEFPKDITNKIFHSDIYIGENKLSNELVEAIVYSDGVKKTDLLDLPENNGNAYNLVYTNGSYVTASNDWQIGEIKVTYYYIDSKTMYEIVAKLEDGVLIYTDKFTISHK